MITLPRPHAGASIFFETYPTERPRGLRGVHLAIKRLGVETTEMSTGNSIIDVNVAARTEATVLFKL